MRVSTGRLWLASLPILLLLSSPCAASSGLPCLATSSEAQVLDAAGTFQESLKNTIEWLRSSETEREIVEYDSEGNATHTTGKVPASIEDKEYQAAFNSFARAAAKLLDIPFNAGRSINSEVMGAFLDQVRVKLPKLKEEDPGVYLFYKKLYDFHSELSQPRTGWRSGPPTADRIKVLEKFIDNPAIREGFCPLEKQRGQWLIPGDKTADAGERFNYTDIAGAEIVIVTKDGKAIDGVVLDRSGGDSSWVVLRPNGGDVTAVNVASIEPEAIFIKMRPDALTESRMREAWSQNGPSLLETTIQKAIELAKRTPTLVETERDMGRYLRNLDELVNSASQQSNNQYDIGKVTEMAELAGKIATALANDTRPTTKNRSVLRAFGDEARAVQASLTAIGAWQARYADNGR